VQPPWSPLFRCMQLGFLASYPSSWFEAAWRGLADPLLACHKRARLPAAVLTLAMTSAGGSTLAP
jgi:hypothetical protein